MIRSDDLKDWKSGIDDANTYLSENKEDFKPAGSTKVIGTVACSFKFPDGTMCGKPAEMREGVKNDKPWRGVFCSAFPDHVKWLETNNEKPKQKPLIKDKILDINNGRSLPF